MPIRKRLAAHPDLFAALLLAALNAWICARLFAIEYLDHFDSIEGSFIAIARYISLHWGHYSWWPIWHCGMPFEDTYVPLVHLSAAALATLAHFSAAHAYHIVIAATYSLGPATLYLMAARLGAPRGAAFLAGLLYSLTSPSALLMPLIAHDMVSPLASRRLQVLTVYGEGPHITVMTLVPLALLALTGAVEKRTARAFVWAAVALAVIFLTNVPGTMAAGLAVFCWIAAQPPARLRAAIKFAAGAALFGYTLACYGIPPSAEWTVFRNVGQMHHGFSAAAKLLPILLLLLLAAILCAGYLLTRTRLGLAARWALLYFAMLAPMVLTARANRFEMLPQVGRLHLEMEMTICLLVGSAAWYLYSLVKWWRVRIVLALVLLAGVYYQTANYRRYARFYLRPADPATRSEFTSARWANANLPGQRVYVTGSDAFWWNAFGDGPQVIGCCDQGESLHVLVAAPYLIDPATGPYHELLTKAYLEALGAQAIVVAGPQSTDEYKDIQAPERFDAMLPVLHREMGDTIYAVPQRDHSLAHVIRPGEAVPATATPYEIYAFAQILEDPSRPAADFAWLADDVARIRANLSANDLVALQVPYFSGWQASVGGRRIPISTDGLGFQILHPACNGACEITLRWNGRPDRIPSLLVSLAAIVFALWLIFGARFKAPA